MTLLEAEFFDPTDLAASDAVVNSNWVVLKFGGTSVTGADNWERIANIVRNRHAAQLKTCIVHSAFATISDQLEAIAEGRSDNWHAIKTFHIEQAKILSVDSHVLEPWLDQLESYTKLRSTLATDAPELPELQAKIMSLGELMSTSLSAQYLAQNGVDSRWLDARELLTTRFREERTTDQNLLNAVCEYSPDEELQARLKDDECVVTQGFIARTVQGQTAVLGRGGSDTSAAYLAARLQASRLEVWTDVPGMFSADPRIVPSARTLKALHYDEAQEIAATGSAVLHPRSLAPPAKWRIPVYVRSTMAPQLPGTCIAHAIPDTAAQVKAISYRTGLKLLSLESLSMWQEVGFLAKAFAAFSRYDIAIDLVTTSESNVTVSIDPITQALTATTWSALLDELSGICRVQVIDDCASVSLVGRNIRTMLHQLGPAMEVFAEHKVHMLSQAANDLNFTVVVDHEQGDRLVHKLHDSMIKQDTTHQTFGRSWQELHQPVTHQDFAPRWWETKADALLQLLADRDCAYVYDAATITQRATELKGISALDNVLYAMKANPNPSVLRTVHEAGLSFECVSPGELERLFELFPALDPARVLYTPNFAARSDYQAGLARGVQVTLDNLFPLRHWGADFSGHSVFVRLDPGHGRGHHELVRTAGSQSKFGVPLFELDELAALLVEHQVDVRGIHAHSGSGIMDANNWHEVGQVLSEAAARFPSVKVIDMGGGLGIPEKLGDERLALDQLDKSLHQLKQQFPQYELWMEPGRFVVAESGALLARVTQTKGKGDVQYVGVATGMNSLLRPALYGAYHEIVNLSRLNQPASVNYTVVGPNCETGDRLGLDRALPPCQEGDVLLIANAGAYGHAMSSHYNLREPAQELLLKP